MRTAHRTARVRHGCSRPTLTPWCCTASRGNSRGYIRAMQKHRMLRARGCSRRRGRPLPRQMRTASRVDLAVPFSQKDEANKLGAKWDVAKRILASTNVWCTASIRSAADRCPLANLCGPNPAPTGDHQWMTLCPERSTLRLLRPKRRSRRVLHTTQVCPVLSTTQLNGTAILYLCL